MTMCKYMIFDFVHNDKPPKCEYTKDFCTFCVCGNSKTFNEAEAKLLWYIESRDSYCAVFNGEKEAKEWLESEAVE